MNRRAFFHRLTTAAMPLLAPFCAFECCHDRYAVWLVAPGGLRLALIDGYDYWRWKRRSNRREWHE